MNSFIIIILLLLISSLCVACLNNPSSAIFCLAICYFLTAILLLVLHFEFLAIVIIIIYLSALLLLFTFILMLSNLKEFYKLNIYWWLDLFSLSFLFFIMYSVLKPIFYLTSSYNIVYNFEQIYLTTYLMSNDLDLFIYLYTDFFALFFLISKILFISIIGSLFLLTTNNRNQVK